MRYPKDRPSIFHFENSTQFLAAMVKYIKKSKQQYSTNQKVATLFGFRSQSMLSMLIKGDRKLPLNKVDKVSQALQLNKKEKNYLKLLLGWELAQSVDEKTYFAHALLQANLLQDSAKLEKANFEYLTETHFITLREMTFFSDFEASPARIAKALIPPIGRQRVENSLKKLEAMGILRRDSEGKLVATSNVVSTGDTTLYSKIQSNGLRSFHKQMAEFAVEAVEHLPKEERNISGVSIKLSKENMRKAAVILAETRKKLLELGNDEPSTEGEEVYRVNLQLFPLTKWNKKGKKS